MAENQDQASGGETQGQEGGFPLTVVTQYLKDMSFENPNGAEILTSLKEVPTGTIRVDVRVDPKTPPDVEVTLFLSVEAKTGDKVVYMVETEYAGIFRIGRVSQDVVLPLIMIEAPRLLFPFARNLVALAIQSGGFPPLFINPIDFAALYRDKREQLMGQQQGEGDGNQTVN
ncbi:MAG TPA: protein-export chaperone SecB [Dongiaceae bacterium]|nr:protein-export chaperone SecB [Dongiaceae bacterium]